MEPSTPTHQTRLAYITQRVQAWTVKSDPLWPVGGSFTIARPHSCVHCQDVTLTQQWPQGQNQASFALVLEASLAKAVDACLTGCALYRFFVDFLVACSLDLAGTLRAGTDVFRFQLHGQHSHPRWPLSTPSPPPASGITSTPLSASISLAMEDGSSQGISNRKSFHLEMYVSNRPFELDKRSQRTVQTARDCLERCIKCHSGCRVGGDIYGDASSFPADIERLPTSDIPTRLLQIKGHSGQGLRLLLIETSGAPPELIEAISKESYIALSYCWGADQPIKLTGKTHTSLTTQGVNTGDLPRTLQDAAWFVRKMGRQFLWVDALCILQDSDGDKAAEISRMGTYYGSSAATLSAASASDCNQGFLDWTGPPEGQQQFLTGPISVPFKCLDGDAHVADGHVYLFSRIRPPPEPITTRAWTLQEAFLSRRLLIFAANQMYWCCSSGYSDESGALREHAFGGPESPVELIYPIARLAELPAELGWRRVVASYTRRGLGFAGDKLPAIAALAEAFTKTAADRGRRWKYLAGLQVDVGEDDDLDEDRRGQIWAAALLWHSASWQDCTRPVDYRAPSWSWAAVEGRVDLKDKARQGPISDHVAVRVNDYGVVLKDAIAPFGMVASGFLLLQAKLVALHATIDLGVCPSIKGDDDREPPLKATPGDEEQPTLELRPDSMADIKAIRAGVAGHTDPLPLSLLVVHGDGDSKEAHDGLIVCPASPGLRNSVPKEHESVAKPYCRIGTFILRPPPGSVKSLLDGIDPQLVCLL
ncbi:hypothetical protein MAPG_08820 [Magnaporthiopsis poae ATCC 64411]|uniref:Heterokaryon incompatibility domain-containing protein n=1 Tax=Magnaporthiopsis poae (strain ATCC 64411 / 73-15) TaxID=644358 RepID=A0A0C4E8C0_MAGP6|nr:hypothetical protein MAPG_08820 [Magnaporthiopsis poae ATCC 64411]